LYGGELRPLPEVDPGLTPRAALEDAVLAALRRPPCVVALSGGRDSSALLALACRVARANGLAPPGAVSVVFPGAPHDESSWQRLTVDWLGLERWERVEVRDELDYLGPVAASVLTRHGILYPPHFNLYAPLLERAEGGTLLTGIGGDEVFDRWRYEPLIRVLRLQRPPRGSEVRRAALWLAPEPVRRRFIERFGRHDVSWLTPEAARQARADHARNVASVPRRYDRDLAWLAGRRSVAAAIRSVDVIARWAGARVAHPLLDRRFLAAIAREGGATGLGGRERAWPRLFGDLLPDELLRRSDKATFDAINFAGPSRDFARRWRGEGAPAALVDPAGLRAVWERPFYRMRTGMLLQSLWLATRETHTVPALGTG
jgi:asparagine synthetase B (glutamine-hydrolysing)